MTSLSTPATAQSAKELFSQGAEQFQAGNYAASAELFERGLRIAQKPDPFAYLYLGQAYQLQGKNDQARQAYERAVSLDPTGPTGQKATQRLQSLPGASFRDCNVCPEMVVVPPGSFSMGSPSDETERHKDEGPTRAVRIPYSLAVGKFEVTYGEWVACVSDGACNVAGRIATVADRYPVTEVGWEDAKKYVDWLADKTGKRYRMLSESEWEYAARAGTETARHWGNTTSRACEYANVANMSSKREKFWKTEWVEPHACEDGFPADTAPVGRFKPNAFGLYDMLGNAWEWVQDCYHENGYAEAPNDGSAHVWQQGCDKRVLRGGSWSSVPWNVRSAKRGGGAPSVRHNDLGFRVGRTLLAP